MSHMIVEALRRVGTFSVPTRKISSADRVGTRYVPTLRNCNHSFPLAGGGNKAANGFSVISENEAEEAGRNYRMQCYVKALCEKLSDHPRFAWYLTEDTINMLFKSASLHDIGMTGIPAYIQLKPGHLEPYEFEIMKTHTTHGRDTIMQAGNVLSINVDLLTFAQTIALSHQERWDGSGYPYGIAGDDIPIPARLMAVADVYDALISRRSYKKALSHDKAVQIMIKERGTHFDADMLDAFVDIQEEFRAIAMHFADAAPVNKNNSVR